MGEREILKMIAGCHAIIINDEASIEGLAKYYFVVMNEKSDGGPVMSLVKRL